MTLAELSNYGLAPQERTGDDGAIQGYAMPLAGTATCSHPMMLVIEYRPGHFGCRACGMTC